MSVERGKDFMEINYLMNSGFMFRDGKTLLVFDDYEDPAGAVDAAYDKNDFDRLYIFVTHAHFDHFGTRIRAYAQKATRYIFTSNVTANGRTTRLRFGRMTQLTWAFLSWCSFRRAKKFSTRAISTGGIGQTTRWRIWNWQRKFSNAS